MNSMKTERTAAISTESSYQFIVHYGSKEPEIRGKAKSLIDRQTLPLLLRPHGWMCRTDRYSKLT